MDDEAVMARQCTLFSVGLTCSNVPNAKRRCVVGEDQSDDRTEIEAERQLRQCDTGPNSLKLIN